MITEAILLDLIRLPNSRNGNARYTALFVDADGRPLQATTPPDSSYATLLPQMRGYWLRVETSFKRGRCQLDAVSYNPNTNPITITPRG